MTDTDTGQSSSPRFHSGTPGAMLRQAREAAGLTHAVVGEALHLTVHYIKSLENDDYSKLPGQIFVKGYMRAYARYLKMDADKLLACYDEHLGTLPEIKSHTLGGNYTRKRNDQFIGWAVATTLVVIIGLGTGWWFVGRKSDDTGARNTVPSAAQLANQPASTPVQQRAPAPQTPASTTYTSTPQTPAFGTATGVSAPQPIIGTTTTTLPTALPTADIVSNAATILPASDGQQPVIVPVTTIGQPAVAADVAAVAAAGGTDSATAPAVAALAATEQPAAVTADGVAAVTMASATGGRQINLLGEGADQLQLVFSGNSWVEIDDGRNVRLYNEMLRGGDTLLIKGQAPFQLLFGDGRNVAVTFNSVAIDISGSIRSDATSRVTLSNPATVTVPLAQPAAAATQPQSSVQVAEPAAAVTGGALQ